MWRERSPWKLIINCNSSKGFDLCMSAEDTERECDNTSNSRIQACLFLLMCFPFWGDHIMCWQPFRDSCCFHFQGKVTIFSSADKQITHACRINGWYIFQCAFTAATSSRWNYQFGCSFPHTTGKYVINHFFCALLSLFQDPLAFLRAGRISWNTSCIFVASQILWQYLSGGRVRV